ncbi:MAG: leucine-rich repeat domain-containing protein [Ruminococcaceae bacterium]|nr:leucine-rich repeat domain-containing protein [Oscillospiraceae bacterium]
MKKKLLLFMLCMLLALSGCAIEIPNENTDTKETDANLTRIAELEAELQQARAEHYINQSALTQEIEDLKAKIAVLTGKNENTDDSNSGTSAMVFHYTIENGSATITCYEGSATLVEIPATLDGYSVKKIGERAFEGNTALAAVVVPTGVEEIDWFAFYDCTSLLDITIPTTVTSIGHAVFDGCTHVTITCPAGSYAESYAKSYGITYRNQ